MDKYSARWKSQVAGTVFSVFVLGLGVLANYPYDYVERDGRWVGGQQFGDNQVSSQISNPPIMAGYPFRYWVRTTHTEQAEDRLWSSKHLVANIALFVVVALGLYAFTRWRQIRIEQSDRPKSTRTKFDLIVAITIIAIPVVVYFKAQHAKNEQWKFVRDSLRHGNSYVSAWLPSPVAARLPAGFVEALQRVRHVRLASPTRDLVRRTSRLTTLTGFEFQGGDYQTSDLDGLASNISLESATIASRKVDDELIAAVASLRWLVKLSLERTDTNSEQLKQFDSNSTLRYVNLYGTNVRLSEIGDPAWSQSVINLSLPRPPRGKRGDLKIDGWPKLASLSVLQASLSVNDASLSLRLSSLPNLTRLSLNRMQKHAIYLKDVPKLARLEEDTGTLFFALGSNDIAPGLTWLTDLHLDDMPTFTQLGCFGRDLESFSIRDSPNLRHFELGSYSVLASGTAKLENVDEQQCQAWVDELGDGDGPLMVDLTGLPLERVDLTPLQKNPRIRHLRLSHTGMTFEKLHVLGGMSQLERLDISDCALESDQFDWLLENFVGLQHLYADVRALERVELEHSGITEFLTNRFENVRVMRLVDVPELSAQFHLSESPQKLVIRNAQSLRGFAIEQPWPKNAEVAGLRDLEWFAAGGKELGDEIVDAVLDCASLDRLVLAHTSIQPDKLAQLDTLRQLTVLVLPGYEIDDRITANWHSLKMLQELNLDDSRISIGTYRWISKIDSMRRLSVSRTKIDRECGEVIAELVQLTHLTIADVEMNPRYLIALLGEETLEGLDISGWELGPEMIEALANCMSLRTLVMHDCQCDPDDIQRILDANKNIAIDLVDGDDPPIPFRNIMETYENSYEIVESLRDASPGIRFRGRGWINHDAFRTE